MTQRACKQGVKIAPGSDSRACGVRSPEAVDTLQAGDAATALGHLRCMVLSCRRGRNLLHPTHQLCSQVLGASSRAEPGHFAGWGGRSSRSLALLS